MPACLRKEERESLYMTQALTKMEPDSIRMWQLMLQAGFEKQVELRSRATSSLIVEITAKERVETTLLKFGRLDILIHNAGWVAYQLVQELTPDFLQRAISINLEAPTWLAQAAFPIMKQQNYGRIVLTASDRAIYQQYALSGFAPYAMGKMAQIGLMNVLAVEGKEHGILVNAISPIAKTRMWNVQDEPEDLRPEQVAPGV